MITVSLPSPKQVRISHLDPKHAPRAPFPFPPPHLAPSQGSLNGTQRAPHVTARARAAAARSYKHCAAAARCDNYQARIVNHHLVAAVETAAGPVYISPSRLYC